MALTATMYRLHVALSDVDRGVYETLDLRLARHPSESLRYLVTRTLAYCLAFEEGIAFSKGGLGASEDAPLTVRDATGLLRSWIDIGSPSAERMHKAAKAAPHVAIYTHTDLALLRRDAEAGSVHKPQAIEVWKLDGTFLDAVGAKLDRTTKLELVRSDGQLYVTVGHDVIESRIEREGLLDAPSE